MNGSKKEARGRSQSGTPYQQQTKEHELKIPEIPSKEENNQGEELEKKKIRKTATAAAKKKSSGETKRNITYEADYRNKEKKTASRTH